MVSNLSYDKSPAVDHAIRHPATTSIVSNQEKGHVIYRGCINKTFHLSTFTAFLWHFIINHTNTYHIVAKRAH